MLPGRKKTFDGLGDRHLRDTFGLSVAQLDLELDEPSPGDSFVAGSCGVVDSGSGGLTGLGPTMYN